MLGIDIVTKVALGADRLQNPIANCIPAARSKCADTSARKLRPGTTSGDGRAADAAATTGAACPTQSIGTTGCDGSAGARDTARA